MVTPRFQIVWERNMLIYEKVKVTEDATHFCLFVKTMGKDLFCHHSFSNCGWISRLSQSTMCYVVVQTCCS